MSDHISQEAARELLACCEAYIHILSRPLPNDPNIWDLVTEPMKHAIANAKSSQTVAGPFESETEVRCPGCGKIDDPAIIGGGPGLAYCICRCGRNFDVVLKRISPPLEQPGKGA